MKARRIFTSAGGIALAAAATMAVASETTTYSYDALGRLVSASNSGGPRNGRQTQTSFDPAGNRTAHAVGLGLPSPATSASFAIAGPGTVNEGQNAVFTIHQKHSDRRTVDRQFRDGERHRRGARRLYSAKRHAHGQRSAINRRYGDSTSFAYDAVDRPQTMTEDLGGATADVTTTFGYNASSQIVSRTRDNEAYVFGQEVNVSRTYTVNGLNQYQVAGPASFLYDANGNLTSDGSVAFSYDVENRLVSASGGRSPGLRYDPLGRLYEANNGAGGGITRFLYDGDELVAEYDASGNMLRGYVHGTGADDPGTLRRHSSTLW